MHDDDITDEAGEQVDTGPAAQWPDERVTIPSVAQRTDHAEMIGMMAPKACYLRSNMDATPSMVTRMLVKADYTAQECIGETLEVVGYALGHGEMPPDPETGEIKSGYWLRMLLSDGTTVGTGSLHFMRAFAAIASIRGEGRWDPPAPVKVVGNKRAKGTGQWLQCYLEQQ